MSKKKSLGRGLSALIDPNSGEKAPSQANPKADPSERNYRLINIELIAANPAQPRSHFDEEKLQELATSIKNHGIIEPIIVNPKTTGGKETYEIIAGERRLRASKLAGVKEVPVIIRNEKNEDLLELMLIENLQREDLTPMEEAQSFESILNKKNLTQNQLADLLGKSRSYITNMIRILKAPLSIKNQLAKNQISMTQVRALLSLPEPEMISLAERAVAENLSVRELEKLVSRFQKHPSKSPSTGKPKTHTKDPNISEIEQMYRERLKTKVTIHPLKNKKGKIEIEYYDYDELLEILNKIQ